MIRRWPIHFFVGLAVIVLISAGTFFARTLSQDTDTAAEQLPVQGVAVQEIPPFTRADIIDRINEERKSLKLEPLQENALLNQSAQLKANDLQEKNYWAHTAPDGTEPWAYIDQVGYEYQAAAENLGKCYESPEAMIEAWKQSPTHYATIIGYYDDVGVGMRIHTLDCIIIVNHFGKK